MWCFARGDEGSVCLRTYTYIVVFLSIAVIKTIAKVT